MPDPSDCPTGARAYFEDFADGRYDKRAHLAYIYPAAEARLSDEGHLVVGRPGVDGLEFAFRSDAPGLWIWYPIDREWRPVAADIHELDRKWRDGTLTL